MLGKIPFSHERILIIPEFESYLLKWLIQKGIKDIKVNLGFKPFDLPLKHCEKHTKTV